MDLIHEQENRRIKVLSVSKRRSITALHKNRLITACYKPVLFYPFFPKRQNRKPASDTGNDRASRVPEYRLKSVQPQRSGNLSDGAVITYDELRQIMPVDGITSRLRT